MTARGTKILPCTCDHAYQNKRCGHGLRVHNLGVSGGALTKYICTVCRAEKLV